jgi:hypothetical protein
LALVLAAWIAIELVVVPAAATAASVTFTSGTGYDSGSAPQSVVLGKVAGSAAPDIVTANGSGDSLSTLLNNGSGQFSQPATVSSAGTGVAASRITLGDFTGNGILDAAFVNGSSTVYVMLGNGHGGFGPATAVGTLPNQQSGDFVKVYDMNGDGKADLVVEGTLPNSCINSESATSVLLGNGNSTFQSPVQYPTGDCGGGFNNYGSGATGVAIADVNGDGDPDIVLTSSSSDTGTVEGYVYVLLNMGNGTFGTPTRIGQGGGIYDVAVGYLTASGHADIVTEVSSFNDTQRGIYVFDGNGNGTFQSSTYIADPALTNGTNVAGQGTGISIADVDGDGSPDIVTADSASLSGPGGISVYLNGDGGSISSPTFFAAPSYFSPADLALGDINCDGKPDAVLANNHAVDASHPKNVLVMVNTTGGSIGSCAGGSGGGGSGLPPPPPSSPCVTGPSSPPHDVVILITGLTSKLPETRVGRTGYDPLAQTYCGLGSGHRGGPLRDLAFMAQNTFDHDADGTIGPIDLTDSLANTGAVLLPFSYDGVSLGGSATKPLYEVAKFDSGTPGAVSPKDEANGYLLGLIHQINEVWPSAHIQVIGHSEGGFVAEQLFENQPLSKLHNVTRIFSLDSPINGVALASSDWLNQLCAAIGNALSQSSCLNVISPALLQLYAERWDNKEPNDRSLIRRDIAEHQIYIPMGTQNDWLYKIADVSTTFGKFVTGVCEGLDTQILWNDFSFSCYLEDIQDQAGRFPSYVSYVTPDPSAGAPARPGFALKSHEFVMQSANNIKFITQYGPGQYAGRAATSALASTTSSRANQHPSASVAASSAPGNALFTPSLTASPFAVLTSEFAKPEQLFTITGSDLGQTPGQVLFPGGSAARTASIRSWSPTRIEVLVPAGAVSGYVTVITASGEQLIPGLVAVLASHPTNVRRLVRISGAHAVGGGALRLRVRAVGMHGRPVPGATIALVGGYPVRKARTNHHGLATFKIKGYGKEQFIAVAGDATVRITGRWRRAPQQNLSLTIHKHKGRHGRRARWTVLAKVRKKNGRSVAGQLVAFQLYGLRGAALSQRHARTDKNGRARITLSVPAGGMALVQAVTDYATLVRGITVTN